ncbi:MAG: ABC transporter ATP-binding protein [Actinomycetota bacterium]|nr:ABC transporter ATP-binding protein [Actinomycetota bacterium]
MTDTQVLETEHLTKRYGPQLVAVHDLDLRVRRGEVYGFLGPNGAGKTTTLRMLLGLIAPTSGTVSILGSAPGSPEALARIGALVEGFGFYPYLSGRRNLQVVARYAGVPAARVDGALDQVGLTARGGDAFKGYSLGMKQRLGLAAALLKDPALLILDEPTNGLDPEGMADMRALIRQLGRGERSVVLSSHLLGEVEQICDRVGVIQKGRLVVEGTVADLRGQAGLLIRTDSPARAREILATMAGVGPVAEADGTLRLTADPSRAAEINRRLVEGGVAVSELRPAERSLEEAFLELTHPEGGVAR